MRLVSTPVRGFQGQDIETQPRIGEYPVRNLEVSSLLYADDVILLASSVQDLQRALERFAAECEAAGMRISTSKSETMVLSRKSVDCLLRVDGEILPRWRS